MKSIAKCEVLSLQVQSDLNRLKAVQYEKRFKQLETTCPEAYSRYAERKIAIDALPWCLIVVSPVYSAKISYVQRSSFFSVLCRRAFDILGIVL